MKKNYFKNLHIVQRLCVVLLIGSGAFGLISVNAVNADAATITLTGESATRVITSTQYGEVNNCLNFEGAKGNFVDIPDYSNKITDELTIETWVLLQSEGLMFICSKGYESQEIHTSGEGNLRFIPTPGVWLDATGVLSKNRWTHVAVVYAPNRSLAKIYINGSEVPLVNNGSNPLNTPLATNGLSFNLGRRSGGQFYFSGSLDEFCIWNRALTQEEINANMLQGINSDSQHGLVAYYTFNAGKAGGQNAGTTTLKDQTGNFDGTLNGFTLADTTSNWVESYAMVVPVSTTATGIMDTGFTAHWNAPLTGVAEKYLLDVATDANFSNYVGSYHNFDCGNKLSQSVTSLSPNTTYYFRMRAEKSSVANQGAYSNTIQLQTASQTSDNLINTTQIQPYPNPTTGKLYIKESKPGAITALKLYNSTGQQILSLQHPTRPEIDLSPYPDGIYYLEITDPESVHTFKVLKANQTGN